MYLLGLKQNISGENNRDITNRCDSLKEARSSRPVEKQVAILYATIHDYLVNVKVPDVAEYEKSLYEYLDNDAAGAAVMDTIRTTGNLDKDTEEQLKAVLTRYTESFVKAH